MTMERKLSEYSIRVRKLDDENHRLRNEKELFDDPHQQNSS